MEEKIYFSDEDIFDKISDILSKNGIEETPLDAALKKEKSFLSITLNLSKDILKGKISEKDFFSLLQAQLKTSKKAADNILKEVKIKILPLAEKVKISNQPAIENKSQDEGFKTAKPARLIEDRQEKTTAATNEEKKIEEELPKKFVQEERPKSSRPDKYREPIE